MLASLWAPETALETLSVIGPETAIGAVATGANLASKATFAISGSRYALFGKAGANVRAESAAKILTHVDPLELHVTH